MISLCFRNRFRQRPAGLFFLMNDIDSGSKLTLSDSFISPADANTSRTYSGNPNSLSALSICSVAMVFLASRSAISLASEDMRVMNSTQQSMSRSLASRAKVMLVSPGSFVARISVIIFCTVAFRMVVSEMKVAEQSEERSCCSWRMMGESRSNWGDGAHLLVRRGHRCLDTCQPWRLCRKKSTTDYILGQTC